jgi:phosphoglycolate phosphatase-like HAD superfamily hydrolase
LNSDFVFILDFDGTLVDTNEVKLRVFELIFPEIPPHDIRKTVHKTSGNRFDIINKLDMLVQSQTMIFNLSDRVKLYNDISTSVVNKAIEVKGATDFLKMCLEKKIDLHISSATPQFVIADLITQRGWSDYFKGIHGSPELKISHIGQIKKATYSKDSQGDLKKKFIYFGDTKTDFEAAIISDIKFFGMFIDGIIPEWANKIGFAHNYIDIFEKLDAYRRNENIDSATN